MTAVRLALITIDCADPHALGTFWAQLLGGVIVLQNEHIAVVRSDRGAICAVAVAGYEAPTWPGGERPSHVHLDLAVVDLDAAEAEAARLGARRATEQPGADHWRVMLDPAGHPFCLSRNIPMDWPT